MSRKVMTALLCLLTALNVVMLAAGVARKSRAAVGGMSFEQLVSDPDFARAVKAIVEGCTANVDIGKLHCS